jgi:hypothetical protein
MSDIPRFVHWILTRFGVVFVALGGFGWYIAPTPETGVLGVIGGVWAMCQVSAGLLKWAFKL